MILPAGNLVKICGLRTIELAQATSDAGADLIGFVFAPSRRQVTADQAGAMIRGIDGPAIPVGLFVDHSVDEINDIARVAGLDLLQLHWRADESDYQRVERPYYVVRRTEPDARYETIAPQLEQVFNSLNPPLWVLIDAYHPEQSGGTGLLSDWNLAASLADPAAKGAEAVLIEEDGHEPAMGFAAPVRVRSVLTARHRLSIYEGVTWGELYDLQEDPHETTNLFDDPSSEPLRRRMFELLARQMMIHADRSPFPTGRA